MLFTCCFSVLHFISKCRVLTNVGGGKMKAMGCENEMLMSCKIKRVKGYKVVRPSLRFVLYTPPYKTSISIWTLRIKKKIVPSTDMALSHRTPILCLGLALTITLIDNIVITFVATKIKTQLISTQLKGGNICRCVPLLLSLVYSLCKALGLINILI